MKIYMVNDYLKEKFGCKVYKLSLNAVNTCPNRDGTIGEKGCIFCSNHGSGEFSVKKCNDINAQIETAKSFVKNKINNGKYIAYFQNFTNTYAPIDYLKSVFFQAINHPDIVILSIATRPDCLGQEILDLLNDLNKIKPVWVELGLQTIHEDTAQYIRRGYPLSVYNKAVKNLKLIGINVITHMIIGLPTDTEQKIYETARYIGSSGADGIKFHLLHVIKDTDLETEFNNGKINLPTLEEYTEILSECIRLIPPNMQIHRLTGDGSKNTLIAPLWSADKKKVLNYINKHFNNINLTQGEHLKNS